MCPAFVADCLETVEEIGIRAREQFKAAGGEELVLVPSLNATPPWVDAVCAIADAPRRAQAASGSLRRDEPRCRDVYGDLLIVRPPVPATVNKAGANYKSEVTHLEYSPRRAYDEWLSILDAIVACGGDALYQFEAADDPFLDHDALEVDGDGAIRPAGSREVLGRLDDVMTGRVFAANGPWVTRRATARCAR